MASPPNLQDALKTLELWTLDPAIRSSSELMADLLDESFREIGESGQLYRRDDVLTRLAQEPGGEFEVDELEVLELGDGIALVTYRAIKAARSPLSSGISRRSSIWRREGDRWRMIFHQGTSIQGDSGGRE